MSNEECSATILIVEEFKKIEHSLQGDLSSGEKEEETLRISVFSQRKRTTSKWLTLNSKLDVYILRTKEAPNSNRSSCTRMCEEPEEEENAKVLEV